MIHVSRSPETLSAATLWKSRTHIERRLAA
jgi:hypothetical protein